MADVPATIVVAVDPSPTARVALAWAAALAAALGAELVIVHARGLLEATSQPAGSELAEWLVALVDSVDPGVAVRVRTSDGPPPEVVLGVAAAEGADLIVVGRRGMGSPFELTLGSTSREVTSRAPVAVAVIPSSPER